jgi:hypothetical protein
MARFKQSKEGWTRPRYTTRIRGGKGISLDDLKANAPSSGYELGDEDSYHTQRYEEEDRFELHAGPQDKCLVGCNDTPTSGDDIFQERTMFTELDSAIEYAKHSPADRVPTVLVSYYNEEQHVTIIFDLVTPARVAIYFKLYEEIKRRYPSIVPSITTEADFSSQMYPYAKIMLVSAPEFDGLSNLVRALSHRDFKPHVTFKDGNVPEELAPLEVSFSLAYMSHNFEPENWEEIFSNLVSHLPPMEDQPEQSVEEEEEIASPDEQSESDSEEPVGPETEEEEEVESETDDSNDSEVKKDDL